MSRVGNKLIVLKEGVLVEVKDQNVVTVKGPKGEITKALAPSMDISVSEGVIKITRQNDSIIEKTLHGTTRALLNNMVEGVTNGFVKIFQIEGVGYKAALDGKKIVVNAGYSHNVKLDIPAGLTVTCPTAVEIHVSGIEKELVGEFAANIKSIRKVEPYHGKGIRYKGEKVRRKEGKKAK